MASTYIVTRSTTIDAPPQQVFPHIADFHRWQAWSPWEALDPDQRRTYSGAESGAGSVYSWSGNRKVGEGSMTMAEAVPDEHVTIGLKFIKPFKSTSQTTITLRSAGSGTNVEWTMVGPQTLMSRLIGVVRSMDAMVGPDFERGLRSLKHVVEAT
jgi:uncharacterized protein YndB with AHSA1/START domain